MLLLAFKKLQVGLYNVLNPNEGLNANTFTHYDDAMKD